LPKKEFVEKVLGFMNFIEIRGSERELQLNPASMQQVFVS